MVIFFYFDIPSFYFIYNYVSKEEILINDVLSIPKHENTRAGWQAKPYIHQLCANSLCCLEYLPSNDDDVVIYGSNNKRCGKNSNRIIFFIKFRCLHTLLFFLFYNGKHRMRNNIVGLNKLRIFFGLVCFYGISAIVSHLMLNPFYSYIQDIWFLNTFCW